MIVSAKLNYSIKAVLELARNAESGRLLNLETISVNQNIPQPFLLQLMGILKSAGIVESIRGVSGGYLLAKKAAEIKLKDIILAVEPSLLVNKKEIKNANSVDAAIEKVWAGARENLEKHLQKITLEMLLETATTQENFSYSI